MKLDFKKCEINPEGWDGYIKIVYKGTPETALYTSIHESIIEIILKLAK